MDKTIKKVEQATTKYTNNKSKKIDKGLTNITEFIDLKHKQMLEKEHASEKVIKLVGNKSLSLAEKYYNLIEPYFEFARKSTVYLNWPYFWWLKKRLRTGGNVLYADGVHFFVALQGGGKSSIAFHLISDILKRTGKSAYVNANFEKHRYDPIKKQHYKYFQFFKLLEFFDMSVKLDDPDIEVTQLKRFNSNFDTIVLDEWLTEMNHRMNKTKEYNNVFMALLNMIAHMRHQGMRRIYVLSQIDNTDIQLLSMFKYIHELEIDLDIPYAEWIESGKLEKHIMGWDVWTYGVSRNKKAQRTDKVLVKKQYVKNTTDFEHFDTYAQAGKYEALPEDPIKFI